jgi:hypothetical protein
MPPTFRLLRRAARAASPWSVLDSALARHLPLDRRRPARRRPILEPLEDRWLMATIYTVTSTADTDTSGTLRNAITQANTVTPTDTNIIDFNLPSGSVIELESALPALSAGSIAIDGPSASSLTVERDPTVATQFGVFVVDGGSNVSISGLTIAHGDTGGGLGGGIDNSGTLTLTDSTLVNNTAYRGGGLFNSGTATVNGCDFTSNSGLSGSSSGEGGGMYSSGGHASLSGCTLRNNTAQAFGGGISVFQGALTITNSTLTGNSAYRGGGIEAVTMTCTLINCTIADNTADDEGGGIFSSGYWTTLGNTIVADNQTVGNVFGPDTFGVFISLGYNLIGNDRDSGGETMVGSPWVSTDQTGTAAQPLDPMLGPLQNNGGPTPTMALLPGSPAIDKGGASLSGVTVPTIDQRGAVRGPAGLNAGTAPDVGAYEASSSYLVTSTADDGSAVGTLRTAVNWAFVSTNANPSNSPAAPNTIVFDLPSGSVINLESALPALSASSMAIDGPGASSLTVERDPTLATQFSVFVVDSGSTVSISGLTIAHGAADDGAGIDNSGRVTLSDATLADNTADDGGGLFNNGTATLNGSDFTGNSGLVSGGGVANSGGTASVSGCTFQSNSAGTSGGGVFVLSGTVTLTNSTLVDNSAGTLGGGIANDDTLTLINATIADNSASTGGGIANLGTATLANTIVWGNTASIAGPDVDGLVNSLGYNLIGNTSGGIGFGGTDLLDEDPLFAPLGNYGGPTQTLALLPGSPAIDAGSASIPGVTVPNIDQRGLPRSNGVDIGAFQSQGFQLTLVTGSSPQSAAIDTPFANALAVTVTANDSEEPVAGGILSFSAPSSGASAVLSSTTATIGSNGVASVTATANGTVGSYAVTATASGIATPASFQLTNTAAAVIGFAVSWGTSGTATLNLPATAGGLILAAGRQNDLPWLGIDQFNVTLSTAAPLAAGDITITSAVGVNYGPVTVSGSGTNYTIKLAQPIDKADRLTITIGNATLATFSGVLAVLPGDVLDLGVINAQDLLAEEDQWLGVITPTIFGEVLGDGSATQADYLEVRALIGTKLPPPPPPA